MRKKHISLRLRGLGAVGPTCDYSWLGQFNLILKHGKWAVSNGLNDMLELTGREDEISIFCTESSTINIHSNMIVGRAVGISNKLFTL